MKKWKFKLLSIIIAFCLVFAGSSYLIYELNKMRTNSVEMSTSAIATSFSTFSQPYNKKNFVVSQTDDTNVFLPDSVNENVTMGYETILNDNEKTKTSINVIEQINSVGNLEDYIEVNGLLYGNIQYDENRQQISNLLNYNNVYYEYEDENVVSLINNDKIYDYEYLNNLLTKIYLNDKIYAEFIYNNSGKIIEEKYYTLGKIYEHTNVATIEKSYDPISDTSIIAKIYDYVNDSPYVLTYNNISVDNKNYNLVTKIQYENNVIEFEYNYFYNDVAYITQVTENGNSYNLTYLNDKILTKTTNNQKTTFVYSSSNDLVGLVVGQLNGEDYNQAFVTFVKDGFNNVIEANYLNLYENDEIINLSVDKIYEQEFNSYGNKIYQNDYNTNVDTNIGFLSGLCFNSINVVYLNGNLYSPLIADFIQNQTNQEINYRNFNPTTSKRIDPTINTAQKSIAIESLQNEIKIQLQTSSIAGLKLMCNEFFVGVADVFTLPVDLDETNLLKYPSKLFFVANLDNQTEVDYYKNLIETNFQPNKNTCVVMNNYYNASLSDKKLEYQFIYNKKLYTVSYIQDGLYGYTSKSNYTSNDYLQNKNIINYDTGKYITYHVSTLNTDNYVSDMSIITNFNSTKDLDKYFESLGYINTTLGQTYKDVNYGDNADFIENLLNNSCNLNLPEFDPQKQYITIDENGSYVVNDIPADASVEETPYNKNYMEIEAGIMKVLTAIGYIVGGVLLLTSCGPIAIICGVIAIAGGVVVGICGVAQIVEGATGTSWIVENVLGGNSQLLETISSVASTVASVALIVGSLTYKTCFVEGTKISTLNGQKNIEDIKVGDYVLSYDEISNKQTYSLVTQTYTNTTNKLCKIKYDNTEILSTPSHPFYVDGQWIMAQNLKSGDFINLSNGQKAKVKSCDIIDTDNVKVYNFNVNSTHTYYAENVLVHNACKPQDFTTKETDELFKSKEYQDTIKELQAKYKNVNFQDYAQAQKFWSSHRVEFNKLLAKNLKFSNNEKLLSMIDNLKLVEKNGVNPILKVVTNGKTTLVRIQHHHIYGKLNPFELYPMTGNNHRLFHLKINYNRFNPQTWRDFADFVKNMLKGIM